MIQERAVPATANIIAFPPGTWPDDLDSDSQGNIFAAKPDQGILQQDGQNVTAQIVVNPQ